MKENVLIYLPDGSEFTLTLTYNTDTLTVCGIEASRDVGADIAVCKMTDSETVIIIRGIATYRLSSSPAQPYRRAQHVRVQTVLASLRTKQQSSQKLERSQSL